MSLKRKVSSGSGSGDGDFERPPAGTHAAVCVAVVATGTFTDQYKDQPPRDSEKLYLAWELVDEKMADGRTNFVAGREYTLSLHERSNLGKLIKDWMTKPPQEGEEFDFALLAGRPILV